MTTVFSAPDTDGIWREKIIPSPVPPPVSDWQTDTFTCSAGQTNFALSHAPFDPANIIVWINGVRYTHGTDYTVAVALITWSNAAFSLEAGDQLQAYYEV